LTSSTPPTARSLQDLDFAHVLVPKLRQTFEDML
jgi:hypothetical protein